MTTPMTPDQGMTEEDRALIERVLGEDGQDALDADIFTTDEISRLLAAARTEGATSGWRDIESAPRPKEGEPMQPVVLLWTNIDRGTGTVSHHVGEAYWSDHQGGGWWWANTNWGDYYSDQISESITGHIIGWQPLPAAPQPRKMEGE